MYSAGPTGPRWWFANTTSGTSGSERERAAHRAEGIRGGWKLQRGLQIALQAAQPGVQLRDGGSYGAGTVQLRCCGRRQGTRPTRFGRPSSFGQRLCIARNG